jgi:hypothetical protein
MSIPAGGDERHENYTRAVRDTKRLRTANQSSAETLRTV